MPRRQKTVIAGLVGVGLASALLGWLPWLVHGGRLALQNLWATSTVNPAEMPVVLLPFSQYQLDLVAATIVVGSGFAGVAARILAAHGFAHVRIAVAAGLLTAQLAALVQTSIAVGRGLRHPGGVTRLVDDSVAYLVIVIAWIVLAIAVGVVVFGLVSRSGLAGRGRRVGAGAGDSPAFGAGDAGFRASGFGAAGVIGISIVAVFVEAWIRGFVAPITEAALSPRDAGLFLARWAPAAAVGVAIAWAGLSCARRIVAALVSLVVLWIGAATLVAVVAAAGSRALARLPGELASAFSLVFAAELHDQALSRVGVAAGIGVLGSAIRWLVVTRAAARTGGAK